MQYMIVETGGKQYKVAQGDIISVEKIEAEPGDQVELDKVLMVVNDDQVTVGTPYVSGAKAVAKVLEQGKDKKILVFKYRANKHYRRRYGHRQPFTKLVVETLEA